jgi:hypothetical protein
MEKLRKEKENLKANIADSPMRTMMKPLNVNWGLIVILMMKMTPFSFYKRK